MDPLTKAPYKSEIKVDSGTHNQPAVDRMGHLKVLRALEYSADGNSSVADHMFYVKVKDYKKEAINYSIKHQVLSKYTAFICVGKNWSMGSFRNSMPKAHKQFIYRKSRNMMIKVYVAE